MSNYIVTYDLMKSGQNYTCLTTKLKAYGTWCHLQGSVWVISTSQTATQVRDNLASCLDSNDKLFVGQLSGGAAWIGHTAEISNWLKQNL